MKTFKSTDTIRVATVGYGGAFNMGRKHLEEMAATGMVPAAVCEIDEERLKVAEQEFPGIRTYTDVDEMLEKTDVNLAVIITPHNLHAPIGLKCLEAGCHVVSEKPITITTKECDDLIKTAEMYGLLVTAYHNRHWDGCILTALDIVKSGKIGDIVRIEAHMGKYGEPWKTWRGSKKMSGGLLYDWGVHLLEYSLQLIDSEVTEVMGVAKEGFWAMHSEWGKDTTEDEAFACVRFKNGAWLTLCITGIDMNPKAGQLEITGTEGTLVFDGGTYTLITRKDGRTITEKGNNRPSEQEKFYRNIAAYLTGKADLIITPEWSRRPIHILDLAKRSAEQGRSLNAVYG